MGRQAQALTSQVMTAYNIAKAVVAINVRSRFHGRENCNVHTDKLSSQGPWLVVSHAQENLRRVIHKLKLTRLHGSYALLVNEGTVETAGTEETSSISVKPADAAYSQC